MKNSHHQGYYGMDGVRGYGYQPTYVDQPIGALKTQLSKLLLSFDRIGWERNATSGRFDMRRVNRMMAGAERVFRKRVEAKAVKTVVSIVVDLSASMQGTRAREAAKAAWAIAQCIERVGCEVDVVGFKSAYLAHEYADDMASADGEIIGESEVTGRSYGYSSAKAVVFKTFRQKLETVRDNFEYMHLNVDGGTPDYHVVRTVTENLSEMSADRRVVLVLTDGVGDDEYMRPFTEFAERSLDTVVLGIGIQSAPRWMEQSYKRFAIINSVADLGTGAIKSLIDQIKSRDAEKARGFAIKKPVAQVDAAV